VSTASRLTGEDRRAELEGLDIRTSWPMSTVPSAGFPQSSSCGFAWSKHFRTTHAASPCPGPPQRAGPALDLTGASRPRVRCRRSPQATPTHCLCIHVDACGRVAVRRPAVPVGRCGEGTPFASVFTEHGPLAGILVQGKLIRPQRDAPSGARLRGFRGRPQDADRLSSLEESEGHFVSSIVLPGRGCIRAAPAGQEAGSLLS
jgi:hypothetical protein